MYFTKIFKFFKKWEGIQILTIGANRRFRLFWGFLGHPVYIQGVSKKADAIEFTYY